VGLTNLGSESETCVGSRVRLVGVLISFEKNFFRLPFTPPSLVRRIGPSRRSSKFNLIRSLFKSWFPVRLLKRPPFRTPVLSQRTPIHAGSLGRVRGQVEFFRKITRAPLATAATRTPYVIYLGNRSRISKGDRKTKTS
jgi:hypothetical protein